MLLKAAREFPTVLMKVDHILENIPETRDSDDLLVWTYRVHFDRIPVTFEIFCANTSADTILRAKRDIQQLENPDPKAGKHRPSNRIAGLRKKRAERCKLKVGRYELVDVPNPW